MVPTTKRGAKLVVKGVYTDFPKFTTLLKATCLAKALAAGIIAPLFAQRHGDVATGAGLAGKEGNIFHYVGCEEGHEMWKSLDGIAALIDKEAKHFHGETEHLRLKKTLERFRMVEASLAEEKGDDTSTWLNPTRLEDATRALM
jgi:hypothetical protein